MTDANLVLALLQNIRCPGGNEELLSTSINLLRCIADSTTVKDFTYYEAHTGNVPVYVKLLLSSDLSVYAQAAQALGQYGKDVALGRVLIDLLDKLPKVLGLPPHDPENDRDEVGEDGEMYPGVVSPYFFGVRPALVLLFCGSSESTIRAHALYAAKVTQLSEAIYSFELPSALPLPPPRTPSPPRKVIIHCLCSIV